MTDKYKKSLENNPYGYPYNPPGFEVPFAMEIFARGSADEKKWWVEEQVRRCYDFRYCQMSQGTEDSHTHAARLYEATRLPDIKLSFG